jgi:hypothetical protein
VLRELDRVVVDRVLIGVERIAEAAGGLLAREGLDRHASVA